MTARPPARRRAGAPAVLAVLVVLAGIVTGCGHGAPADRRLAQPGPRTGANIATSIDTGVFTVDCRYSHRAPDDPIVYFGRPGASHMHDFFGAHDTAAATTAASLIGGATTCEDPEDTAAYWAPTVYAGTTALTPNRLRAYYRAAVGADVSEVRPPPTGLELIAGDMHRPRGDWPDLAQVGWGCGWRPVRYQRTPPTNCSVRSPLNLRLVFPDCWDGRNVRSADHRSHVAYGDRGRCPSSHPVPILQVQVSIEYPVWASTPQAPSVDARDLVLASGGFEGTHGDFFNAWDPDRLAAQTDLCVRSLANCTIG